MVDFVLNSASHIIIHRVISIGKYQIIRKSTSIIHPCVRREQINNAYILDFDLYRNEHWLMLDLNVIRLELIILTTIRSLFKCHVIEIDLTNHVDLLSP